MQDILVHAEKFHTVREMAAHLDNLMVCFGDTLRESAVEVASPDDRSSPPYIKELQVWATTLSDSSVVFNLRVVEGEA